MDQETLDNLMTEEELRQEMGRISRGYNAERKKLRDASKGIRKRKARVRLAAIFLEPELFTVPEAIDYIKRAKKGDIKLTNDDKAALVDLEMAEQEERYRLAEFDCETSDKAFDKCSKQLSWYQSVMKFTGPTVPLSEEPRIQDWHKTNDWS